MNLRHAWQALWAGRRRNRMSLAGIVVGVATVVAILGLTFMVRRETLRQFDRSGLDLVAIQKTATGTGADGREAPAFALDLAEGLADAVPELDQIAPILEKKVSLTLRTRDFATDALGVTPEFFAFNRLTVTAGRALAELDRMQPFVVLGRDRARALADQADATSLLGTEILIGERMFTVVGILAAARPVGLHAGDINQAILLPAATFERAIVHSEITTIYARIRPGTDLTLLATQITDYFRQRTAGLGVQVTSAEQIVAEMERQLRLFAVFIGAAGVLALLLGGAAMLNSLLLAVAERGREIGLRRALGATRRDVQAQFLAEALSLCGVGGVLGVGLGLAAMAVLARVTGWAFVIAPVVPVLGLAVALGLGLAAGFFPAWQAARLDPASALKPEG